MHTGYITIIGKRILKQSGNLGLKESIKESVKSSRLTPMNRSVILHEPTDTLIYTDPRCIIEIYNKKEKGMYEIKIALLLYDGKNVPIEPALIDVEFENDPDSEVEFISDIAHCGEAQIETIHLNVWGYPDQNIYTGKCFISSFEIDDLEIR